MRWNPQTIVLQGFSGVNVSFRFINLCLIDSRRDTMSDSTVPQPNEEQLIRSAEIILFRPRAAPPTIVPGQSPVDAVSEPQQRLVRALDSLNAAMAAQRDAMAQWRASLAELKTTTSGLGQSLERYRGNLDALGKDVASLHRQAKTLQAWAEKPIIAK
jgi:hypothetical protein